MRGAQSHGSESDSGGADFTADDMDNLLIATNASIEIAPQKSFDAEYDQYVTILDARDDEMKETVAERNAKYVCWWQRRDIKSLNLLGQCMAKQQAAAQGAFEAWMLEDGMVTEGASSSAFIIKDKTIITRALSNAILPGIRRRVILELAELASVTLVERSFSLEEALAADEAFISSATTLVMPVVSIDGKVIADGKPGPLTQKLRSLYIESLLAEAASK